MFSVDPNELNLQRNVRRFRHSYHRRERYAQGWGDWPSRYRGPVIFDEAFESSLGRAVGGMLDCRCRSLCPLTTGRSTSRVYLARFDEREVVVKVNPDLDALSGTTRN